MRGIHNIPTEQQQVAKAAVEMLRGILYEKVFGEFKDKVLKTFAVILYSFFKLNTRIFF